MSVAQIFPSAELETPANPLGLGGLTRVDGRPLPLREVKVRASIAGSCARTVVEQRFANPFDEILDVTWIFPLPEDGALVDLELRAGEILIKGECKEKSEAKADFDAARAQGKRAALVEKEKGDVHTLSLAGLPPRTEVVVRLTLVEHLPSVDGRFRWRFPTTIAPRYTPGDAVGHSGHGTQPDTDAVPTASRLTPPIRLSGGTTLDLEVEIAGPLSALESSLHALKLDLGAGGVRVAPSAATTLNKDFILAFTSAESSATASRAFTDGVHTLVVVEPPSGFGAKGMPRDAVFLVDISGSMGGIKMEAAKKALLGALHGLLPGDRFKLIAFDDRLERFAKDFSAYDDRSLAAADRWIMGLQARGGTEMLPAIQEGLAGSTPSGRLRTVLLITDGQSTDEDRLLPAVANRKGEAVFFTMGIDTAVNAALLKSLARAGGGACELCTPTDDIDAAVARLEARFGSPLLSNLKVAGAARPDGVVVFAGRPASVFIEGAPASVEISALGPQGPISLSATPTRVAMPLGTLWARERVAFLEERLTLRPFEEEAIKPEILRVALAWKIGSTLTSFVAVDHSTVSSGERRHVVQPTELPEAWEMEGGAFGGGGMPVAAPMMAKMAAPGGPPPASPARSRGAAHRHPSAPPPPPPASAPMMDMMAEEADDEAPSLLDRASSFLGISKAKKADPARELARATRAGPPAAEMLREELKRQDALTPDAGDIARAQGADGSFGGDVGRTAAALLALILLGNTRRKGDRRRTVQKAAEWLARHSGEPQARLALDALVAAEGAGVEPQPAWRSLVGAGAEGQVLAQLLAARGL